MEDALTLGRRDAGAFILHSIAALVKMHPILMYTHTYGSYSAGVGRLRTKPAIRRTMSDTFYRIVTLIESNAVRISEHGYDELAEDEISVQETLDGVRQATIVEHYPNFPKGPAVLVLQFDRLERPIHVVWGIPKGYPQPAVLVTAYRPDPAQWSEDFTERLK